MNQPSQAEIDRQTTIQDSIALVSEQVKLATIAEQDKTADAIQEQAVTISDSARQLQNTGIYGSFAPAAIGSPKTYTLENPNVKIEFSNKRGNIISAHLKDYKSSALVDGEDTGYTPLYFMNDGRNRFNYKLSTPNVPARMINTEELYFTPTQSGNSISFKAKTSDGGYIEQSYTLADDGYNVDYNNLVEKTIPNVGFHSQFIGNKYNFRNRKGSFIKLSNSQSVDFTADIVLNELDWDGDVNETITRMPLMLKGAIKIMRENADGNEMFLYYIESGSTCAASVTCCMNNHKSNILATVEKQCDWLLEIGFQEVDCYMKIFELALFGGVKTKNTIVE